MKLSFSLRYVPRIQVHLHSGLAHGVDRINSGRTNKLIQHNDVFRVFHACCIYQSKHAIVARLSVARLSVARLSESRPLGRSTFRVETSPSRNLSTARHHDSESRASAPLKALNQLGVSPIQGNVTALYPTVVTAFPRGKVESNLRRTTSP
jgi:hypothetical protein